MVSAEFPNFCTINGSGYQYPFTTIFLVYVIGYCVTWIFSWFIIHDSIRDSIILDKGKSYNMIHAKRLFFPQLFGGLLQNVLERWHKFWPELEFFSTRLLYRMTHKTIFWLNYFIKDISKLLYISIKWWRNNRKTIA